MQKSNRGSQARSANCDYFVRISRYLKCTQPHFFSFFISLNECPSFLEYFGKQFFDLVKSLIFCDLLNVTIFCPSNWRSGTSGSCDVNSGIANV